MKSDFVMFIMKTIRNKRERKKRTKERVRIFLIVLFCLIAILQSGLRDINSLPLGNDTVNYQFVYEKYDKMSWSNLWGEFSFVGSDYTERDAGYPLFIKATQVVWSNFTFFMFLTAAIFIVPFGLLIRRYVHSLLGVTLAFLIYFALFTPIVNSFMRQAVTLGISLFAIRYAIKRKWKQYYALILVAITLHMSAIVAAPFYFLLRLKQKREWMFRILVLLPILVYFSTSFLSLLVGGTIYEDYLTSETENPINYAIFIVGVSLFAFLAYNNLKKRHRYDALICGVIGSLTLMPIIFLGNTMLRVSYYYVVLLIPLFPILIDKIKMYYEMRIAAYVLTISFFLYFILR